jgi:hypothetical protein
MVARNNRDHRGGASPPATGFDGNQIAHYPTHYLGGTGWKSTESLDQWWMQQQATESDELH